MVVREGCCISALFKDETRFQRRKPGLKTAQGELSLERTSQKSAQEEAAQEDVNQQGGQGGKQ